MMLKDFRGFDDRYTAPIHGFKDALDYWEKCSSKPHIPAIPVPTLIVNAKNDPFLSKSCFPVKEAESNPFVTLCTPDSGGHVGFISGGSPFNPRFWLEERISKFVKDRLADRLD